MAKQHLHGWYGALQSAQPSDRCLCFAFTSYQTIASTPYTQQELSLLGCCAVASPLHYCAQVHLAPVDVALCRKLVQHRCRND
jgi:hypothetical protein